MADHAVVDDAGRAVRPSAVPRRIVSTLPSTTELIVALGAADRLLARDGFNTDPGLAHLPSLGHTLRPNPEAIAAFDPDLVIVPPDRGGSRLVAQLEALDATVYVADVERTPEILSATRRLSRLLGIPERGDSLVASLEAGLAEARRRYRSAHPPTVFYVVWHRPPRTAGPGTFIDDVIAIAGGRNAFADADTPWPEIALEALLRRDPDFIVVPRGTTHSVRAEWLSALPGWRELSAIRHGRVIVVDSDLFNRPGPRVVEAAHVLGRALSATGVTARSSAPGRGGGGRVVEAAPIRGRTLDATGATARPLAPGRGGGGRVARP